MGASLTALHYACMKLAAEEDSSVFRDYFRSFRQNFLQATAIWLLLVLFGLLTWYDLASVWDGAGPVDAVVRALGIVACLVLAILLLHAFAVLAKFSNTIRWGLLAWLLIGFAGVVYFNSLLLRRTFAELIEECAANTGGAET